MEENLPMVTARQITWACINALKSIIKGEQKQNLPFTLKLFFLAACVKVGSKKKVFYLFFGF